MAKKGFRRYFSVLLFLFVSSISFGQNAPLGIFYQAVARDNFGKELANKDIDVRFSIIIENPLGTVVYQELHSDVITSKYGVFSLIIGHGIPTGGIFGELSQVNWSQAFHYLKVEVKFESVFMDMGTMQFLAVPYALYAQKSLEPGPQGPLGNTGPQGIQGLQGASGLKGDMGQQGLKGDTGPQGLQGVQGQKGDIGDPASDDQTLSFNGTNLSISVGNGGTPSTVNLATLNIPHQLSILGDTLSIMGGNKIGLPNQIQNLQLDNNNVLKIDKNVNATQIDLNRFLDDKQQLSFNSVNNTLAITNGASPVDLSKFNQSLSFNPADNKLSISGGATPVDLTFLKNDADYDPTNEIQDLQLVGNKLSITGKAGANEINMNDYLDNTDNQTLAYNESNNTLTITNSSPVSLGSMVAFRAKKNSSETVPSFMTDYDFIAGTIEYNDGAAYDNVTGIFNAYGAGIYTFNVSYNATGTADSRVLKIYLNGSIYEVLNSGITGGTSLTRQITMKLAAGDKVKVIINVGTGFETGIGSFSGFRVY